MKNILQIESIGKQEFVSILSNVVDERIKVYQQSHKDKSLSVQEVADLLCVTVATVRSYIQKGLIPAQKIKRKYLIQKCDLDEVIQNVKSLKYKRF